MLAALLFCAAAASQPSANESPPPPPDAPGAEARLRRALFYFANGEYEAIAPLLEPLITQISNEDDLALARETLGTVYFLLDHPDLARQQFELVLLVRPNAVLDPYSTAPPVLRFFAEVKRETKARSDEVARIFAQRKAHFEAPRVYEKKDLWRVELLSYLPFGIGQFNNGDTGYGVLFLSLEVLFLAANITGYILVDLLADADGVIRVPPTDLTKLKQREHDGFLALQYAGFGAFAATWVIGAVHARLRFQPLVTTISEKPRVSGASLLFESKF